MAQLPRSFYHSSIIAGLSLAAAVASAQESQGPVVTDVTINGPVHTHPDLVRLQLKTVSGKEFSLQNLRDDEHAITLMEQFMFINSRVLQLPDNKIKVIFNVKELPYVGTVNFKGIGYWDRSDLPNKIKTRPGGYLHPHLIETDRRTLIQHFKKEKFLNATIEVEQHTDIETGFVHVNFHISLGKKVKVDQVVFEGLPEGVFKYYITGNKRPIIANAPNAQLQRHMLRWDRRTIANYIRDRGYLNAKVAPIAVDFYDGLRASDPRRRHGPSVVPDNKKNNRALLTVRVDAGERFHLGSVSFIGNSVVSEEELRSAFLMQEDDIFDNRDVTTNIRHAQRIIRNNGYPKAFLRRDMRIELPDEKNKLQHPLVHLTLHVYEGQKYRIGRVDVNGNRITKDAVVRRALSIFPGNDFKEDDVDESTRQLRRIGLFKVVPPNPIRIAQFYDPTRPDEVDLHVEVEEDGTGEIRANAAYSSVQNFVFQISYRERNFDILGLFNGHARGGAQILSTSLTTSSQQTNLNIRWTNPHVFDGPYSVTTFVTRSDQSLDTADWDEKLEETGITLGRYFFKNDLLLSIGYTYTNRFIDDVQADAPDDALAANNTTYDLNAITLRQRYSRLDIPRQPSKGYKIDLRETITGGLLSASDEYYELYSNIDFFFPIAESDFGGRTRIHFGQENRWLEAFGDSDTVPFYRRIRGGGPSPRHRGYEAGYLGPTEFNQNGIFTRPGGTTKWLSTLELIHPLQGYHDGIQGQIFYDLGNVWGADESVNIRDLRSAAGFGIRFPLAFPIALDFAWRLDDKDDEKKTQFHFSIGGVF